MNVVIQIPCLNEASTLPATLAELPRQLPGIDTVLVVVVDDGSSDGTADIAQQYGADRVVRHTRQRGLARAFETGLQISLQVGADIIVNTDGDNQYPAAAIPDLVQPILAGVADIVVGDRQVNRIPHFSPVKRGFHRLGSWIVQTLSGTQVPDAVSGFRAYSREAALRLNVLTDFSYTLETIIQAGKIGLRVVSVPIQVNPPTRPSRLQRNMWHFVKAQASTILRIYAFYEPLRTFSYLAAPFLLAGLFLLARFGFFFLTGQSGIGRYSQSVAIGIGLFLTGVFVALFGVQADIASKHRQMTQELLYRLKKMELERPLPAGEAEPARASDRHER